MIEGMSANTHRSSARGSLLALLGDHPDGLTLAEIMAATGWTRGSALQVATEARPAIRTGQRRTGRRYVNVYRLAP